MPEYSKQQVCDMKTERAYFYKKICIRYIPYIKIHTSF